MTERKNPTIILERVSHERANAVYDALIESWQELFSAGILPDPEPSMTIEELKSSLKELNAAWENDKQYRFQIIESKSSQLVGAVFLNQIIRGYKMANMGYWVRTSRVGEGLATEAAKQMARYGFEQLGFQRIEIVVSTNNIPSLKVAEKIGAVREGLLRNRMQLHGFAHDAYMHSLIPNDYGIDETA